MEATPLPQSPLPPKPQAPTPAAPSSQPAPKSSSLRRGLDSFRAPKTSFIWVFLFVVALVVFFVAYFVFTKPNTGPASLIFSKIFPPESGLIKLQAVDLNVDSIISNPVFSRLKERGLLPIQIPPLGKPNPFL